MAFAEKDSKDVTEIIPHRDVAKIVKKTTVTIDRWIKNGLLPEPIRINGRKYHRQQDLDRLLSGHNQ